MNFSIGIAVILLASGEAKSMKQVKSNKRIVKVLVLFRLIKVIVKPIMAKNANNWSMLPKSNNVNKSQEKNGIPIICPIKMIRRYDKMEMNLNVFNCFNVL